MKKRIIATLLALAMMIPAFPVHASIQLGDQIQSPAPVQTQSCTSGFNCDYSLTGDGSTDMVSIALAQEGRTGAEFGYNEEWCADFICDCAIIASQSDAIPQYGGVAGLYDRILAAGGTEIITDPRPGDLCFINWNGGTSMGHVEVIYQVTDGAVYTIGGNSGSADSLSGRWVKKHAPLSQQYILSILRPNYTASATYTITFDANGGTNAPAPQEKQPTVDMILTEEIPTYEGFVFLGWSLDPCAPQIDYLPGDLCGIDSDITLYAVWGDTLCGDDITWILEDGKLTITGTGVIYDWLDVTPPWYPLRETIISVQISDGITGIGIGSFSGSPSLLDVTLPADVTSIADQAFFGCDALSDVYYGGTQEDWDQVTIGAENDPLTLATVHYHIHTYETVTIDPTCTEQGSITSTCTTCGHIVIETLEPTGHDQENGSCTICGKQEDLTPQIISCYSKAQSSVKVTWTLIEGMDGYELWRTSTPEDEASWIRVKTIQDGSADCYTNQGLTIGTTYHYRVRAYILDEDGQKTYTAFSDPSYMPAAVVFDSPYSNATFRIRLLWHQVQGSHGYQIWRQEEDGSYRLIKTLGDRGDQLTDDQGATTAYSNCDLIAGQDYTYKIRAFMISQDGRKIFGAYSDEITIAVMPDATTLSGESSKSTRAQLTWDAVNGAEGYQIWISDAEDGDYRIVKSVTDGTLDKMTIYDLTSGGTYYFKIRSYVQLGEKKTFGAFSETISVTIL